MCIRHSNWWEIGGIIYCIANYWPHDCWFFFSLHALTHHSCAPDPLISSAHVKMPSQCYSHFCARERCTSNKMHLYYLLHSRKNRTREKLRCFGALYTEGLGCFHNHPMFSRPTGDSRPVSGLCRIIWRSQPSWASHDLCNNMLMLIPSGLTTDGKGV